MKVDALYAPHGPFVGQDLWIIGLGASMRCFPVDFLKGRTCILLKDAWVYWPQLGPVWFSNNKRFGTINGADCPLPYKIVKARLKSDPHAERDDNHVPWDDPNIHCFSYREPPWDATSHFDKKMIWKEPCHYFNIKDGNVAIFAIQFAAQAGARSISLVGCDCCELGHNEYVNSDAANLRSSMSKGYSRHRDFRNRHNYLAYRSGIRTMQKECLREFGIPVVTVSPFVGLADYERQFAEWKP